MREVRVLRWRERRIHHQQVIGAEAGIDGQDCRVAAEQEAGRREQHHGQRDLCDDERVAHSTGIRRGVAADTVLQRVVELPPRRGQRGPRAEQQHGEHGEADRECKHASVDRERRAGERARNQPREVGECECREPDAEHDSAGREHGALRQELAQHAPSRRAERLAHGELFLALRAAREQ